MEEHGPYKAGVAGSSPAPPTIREVRVPLERSRSPMMWRASGSWRRFMRSRDSSGWSGALTRQWYARGRGAIIGR